MDSYSAISSAPSAASIARSLAAPMARVHRAPAQRRKAPTGTTQLAAASFQHGTAIAPVFGIGDPQGSGTYRLRGVDTLTWGPQGTWVMGKWLLQDAATLLNYGMLTGMNAPDLISQLQLYAAFDDMRQKLKVERLIAEIDTALANDCPKQAREMAIRGHAEHPDNPELARLARVLARPKMIAADLPPDPDLKANTAWLQEHQARYSGRWVALRSGSLVAAAPSLNELKQIVGDLKGLMVTRVI